MRSSLPVPALRTPVPLITVVPVVSSPPLAPVKVMPNDPMVNVVVPVIFSELITESAVWVWLAVRR